MFQSTPPAWGATHNLKDANGQPPVSIHAPRVGGDLNNELLSRRGFSFNPRPPRGGRLRMA